MKGIFIILDGVSDQPCQILGQITPLQAAKTPHLDEIANKSKIDYCYTVKEGVIPQSSSAIVSLLGYDPGSVSRGVLEAQGAGIKLKKGDLAFRTNFATIEDLKSKNILDRRAGRTLSTKESQILAKAINDNVKLPFEFEFYSTIQHRGVLVFRGGFSNNITYLDPDYGSGIALTESSNKIKDSSPLDEEEDSKLTADLLNNFARQAHKVLDSHPLNISRARKGLYSANFLLCRDCGNVPTKLKKLKGKWMASVYNPLEIGIAESSKMEIHKFAYPRMKGIDIYANLYSGLKKAIKYSLKMIKKNLHKKDYFFIHIKETDLPGHDNKPLEKVKMIELLDKRFFSSLKNLVFKTNAKLVITADHTTSCRLKSHSADPVPVLFYSSNMKIKKGEKRFTEEQGLQGKKILGKKLLEKTLFSK